MAELCSATITTSDNTAVNLILRSFGGPNMLTAFIRSLGDTVTRHDRYEPALNRPDSLQPMDTTSPHAMCRTLHTLLFGHALQPPSRALLKSWLMANKTGDKRLRAGIPTTWRVGEKTGTSAEVGAADVGFVEPPLAAPLLVSVYLETTTLSPSDCDQRIAHVGALLTVLGEV